MTPFRPRLALCPIGKFVFSHEDAIRQKRTLQSLLRAWGVDFVDLDDTLPDGLVRDQSHVDAAVARFRAAGCHALFLPHCNFGTEGAVGMIARKLGLPALLWGPRDEAPAADGTRLRDTLCGLFASSKVLHKLGVPFATIENCAPEDPAFRAGLERFLRAAAVADLFRSGVRVGVLGQRIDFFWTTIVNESELLERFRVELLPLDMVEFVEAARRRAQRDASRYAEEVRRLRDGWAVEDLEDEALSRVLAVRDEMLAAAAERGLDALAFQSFMSVIDACGAYCSFAESAVSEALPVAAETDVHGALSDLMLRRALGDGSPAYLSEFTVRHPEDDNAVLLWHAGAPLSMRDPAVRPRLGKHWILPSPLSGMTHFPLRRGRITVARFDGDGGEYLLAVGEGDAVDGPATLNNWVWMRVNDWPRWERTLMHGPWIHHVAMGYGAIADALEEACRFIPALAAVRLDGERTDHGR